MTMRKRVRCWLCSGTGKAEVSRRDVLLGPELTGAAIRIIREEAEEHGLTKGDIVGPSRERRLVVARDEVAYRMHKELEMTLGAIGEALGGRNHSTIISALRRRERATWARAAR